MEKVSVIIPIYNTEQFLKLCVQSICCQTYREIEILLIDDGSRDKSLEICRQLKKNEPRIRIIAQEHRGVSAARNRGLEAAQGKYVFFLDSDDAIHPRLIEELVCQIEEHSAQLAFCNYKRLESFQMNAIVKRMPEPKMQLSWYGADEEESEMWFHIKYREMLWGIGGKLVCRDCIDILRFDERLSQSEDTLFLYYLICKKVRMVYMDEDWYFYRMHPGSTTCCRDIAKDDSCIQSFRVMRASEYKKERMKFAIVWEKELSWAMINQFIVMKKGNNKNGCRMIKKEAVSELKHPLFWRQGLPLLICFFSCIFGGPLYGILRSFYNRITKKHEEQQENEDVRIGILTFHCSDNYGAMLQTYGLKQYLCSQGVEARVVPYEPSYMTGRHWWFPYVPVRGRKGHIWCLCDLVRGWYANLALKGDFFKLRANMKFFRTQHLLDLREKPYKKLRFTFQLKKLPYSHYIVGSDQIWNPDITFGLRKAYFGAFENKNKEKVIAYGASLGGSCLSQRYDEEFSELLSHVDVISLREAEAAPYIKQFYNGRIDTVLDPVFLLDWHVWQQIEKPPERQGYILVYTTEHNQELVDYVRALSEEKGLPIVDLKSVPGATDETFEVDRTAGPAEFLGYIHRADYVVTNSFHAVAFSIIYEKPFLAFLHSNRGARLSNVLRVHGLEDRIYQKGRYPDIDALVDWAEVEARSRENAHLSKEFLRKHTEERQK